MAFLLFGSLEFFLHMISRKASNIFGRGIGIDICRIVRRDILMVIIVGELPILGMICDSVPKIHHLQGHQEGEGILKHVVIGHCHEDRGQGKFRIGIDKMKDKGRGKGGWLTTMMYRMKAATEGGAVQKISVGRRKNQLVEREGRQDAREEGDIQTGCYLLQTPKIDRETQGNPFGCENGQVHTDQYFPLTGSISSFRDALDIVGHCGADEPIHEARHTTAQNGLKDKERNSTIIIARKYRQQC